MRGRFFISAVAVGLTACSGGGDSTPTEPDPPEPPLPSTPVISEVFVNAKSVYLAWSGGSNTSTYRVELAPPGQGLVTVGEFPSGTRDFRTDTLVEGTTYEGRVVASNDAGESPSQLVSFDVPLPLEVLTESAPPGVVGDPYRLKIAHRGGVPGDISWLASGVPEDIEPGGYGVTTDTLVLEGIPEEAGTFNVTIRGRSRDYIAVGNFQLLVRPRSTAPQVEIIEPASDLSVIRTDSISFRGSAMDPEGDEFSLVWRNPDLGALGTGDNVRARITEVGTWPISLVATDAIGFSDSATVTVTVEPVPGADSEAPIIRSGSFSKSSLFVGDGPDTLRVSVRVTDEISGTDFVQGQFQSPSGSVLIGFVGMRRNGGDEFDGTYAGEFVFGPNVERGVWRLLRISTKDEVGNSRMYDASDLSPLMPTTISLGPTTGGDVQPPEVVSGSFSESALSVGAGPDTLRVSVRVTDDLSGTEFVQGQFQSPSGGQLIGFTALRREAGGPLDGTYSGDFAFGTNVERGVWKLLRISARDVAGNFRTYSTSDLAPVMPTTVMVGN